MPIIYSPACVSASTDNDGLASIRIRIPGDFGGLQFDPGEPIEGRFLSDAMIWADTPAPGDRVHSFRIEDDEGVIPEELREVFPEYPVIGRFGDMEISSPALEGSYLRPNSVTPIRPGDPDFIAAGLSVVGTFQAGVMEAGRVVRANFNWGKWA